MELINKKVKDIRQHAKKTQQEFADSVGASRSTIALIETGKAVPTYDMLKSISAKYNVKSTFFFADDVEITDYIQDGQPNDLNPNNEATKFTITKHLPDNKIRNNDILTSRLFQSLQLLQQSKKLLDVRMKRELSQTHNSILETMSIVNSAGEVVDLLNDVFMNYFTSPPDPASTDYYTSETLDAYEVEIKDTIDYKKYKSEVIEYYGKLEGYNSHIEKLVKHILAFFEQVRPIDDQRIITL